MKKSSSYTKKRAKPSEEIAAQLTPDGELVKSSARHSERNSKTVNNGEKLRKTKNK